MKRRRAAIVCGALALVAGATASACRAPTQITVVVTAPDDSVCQAQLQTAISVGTTDSYEQRAAASTAVGCASHHVGTLVVIPTGDESEDVAVRVVGSLDGSKCEPPAYGPSCIVERRALHFIPNQSLTLLVRLGAECADVPCNAATTCVNKVCVGATVGDPARCATVAGCDDGALGPPDDAGAGPFDAGSIVDSTVNDASTTNDASDSAVPPPPDDGGADASDAADGGAVTSVIVSVGYQLACARRSNGVVACWGQNPVGQLGFFPSDGGQEVLPRDVAALGSPVALAAGANIGCELLAGGVAKCWGSSAGGVLGVPGDAGILPPTTLATGSAGVCAGDSFTCTIDASGGTVRCWSGDVTDGLAVTGVANAVQLACGSGLVCVRIADGTVRCWGGGTEGDLGVPGAGSASGTVQPAITGVVDLAAYAYHACAALSDGGVMCWGSNGDLESDPSSNVPLDASVPPVQSPTLVAGVSGATSVAVSASAACALLADGGVTCWGDNHASEVGVTGQCLTAHGCQPSHVATLPHAVRLAAGVNETCAVIDDGGVWCWGTNYTGELGRGFVSGDDLPAPVHL